MDKDPVCGMIVGSGDAAGRSEYQGKTYYFCSLTCKERFDHSPLTFAVKKTLDEKVTETEPV